MTTGTWDSPPGRALGVGPGQQEPQPVYCRRQGSDGGRKTDGRMEGGRRGRGTGPGYLRVRAQAVRSRHGCAPPPAVRGTQLLTSSDSRPAAAGDGKPPTSGAGVCEPPRGFLGVRGARTHEEEVCSSANLRAGRKDSRPLSAGAGRGGEDAGPWRMLTYLAAARPRVLLQPAGRLTSGYPETLSCFCGGRRRPAAQTPNFRRRRCLSRQMGVT